MYDIRSLDLVFPPALSYSRPTFDADMPYKLPAHRGPEDSDAQQLSICEGHVEIFGINIVLLLSVLWL
jgi:hypothetical protein